MPSVSVRALITDSLSELNVLAPGEALRAADGAFCLGRLNILFDNWNAEREAVFAEVFETFTLVPSDQDVTIGPTGSGAQWVTTQAHRPVSIDRANLILTSSTPSTRLPLDIVDYPAWAAIRVRGVTTSVPTVLYYEPAWPLGVVHLWPMPSIAYDLELISRGTLSQATIDGTFTMPPGYQAAAMLTLAEDVASAFGRQVTPLTALRAQQARARIFEVNTTRPTIQTRDAGMPSGQRGGSTMNYLDRTIQ